MHIPDGFLEPQVFLTLDALAIPAVGWAARKAAVHSTPSAPSPGPLPLLGVMGAFVFAAQMINIPVGLGVSGHLLGGTLLAVALGPASAVLVLTAVLILQALLFQDGGVLALGANICNMAVVGVLAGYLPCWLWGRRTVPVFIGSALSVLLSGGLALSELSISSISFPAGTWPLAATIFVTAGLLEGAITVATLRAIARLSPRALPSPAPTASLQARAAVAVAAILLVTVGIFFATSAPDGLTHLAETLSLSEHPVWPAPFAGYEISALGAGWLARSAAGLAGLMCVFAAGSFAAKRR